MTENTKDWRIGIDGLGVFVYDENLPAYNDDEVLPVYVLPSDADMKEEKKLAHLITAAPDMLKITKEALSQNKKLQNSPRCYCSLDGKCYICTNIENIESVLAKAEGRK